MALTPEQVELAGSLSKEISRAEKPHKERVDKYKRLDDVYDARLKAQDDRWRHDLHPPFALQFIETVISAIVDEPSDPVVEPLRPDDRDAAPKLEELLRLQEDKDHFREKWPLFVRTGLIRGFAVAKVMWRQEWAETTKRSFSAIPGNIMQEAAPRKVKEMIFDQPSFEVVDQQDFWWNPDARSPEEIDTAYFRTYETKASLLQMQKDGLYDHVDELANTGGMTDASADPQGTTGSGNSEVMRSGPIEIIERWTRDRLVVIANREVVIRDEENPFGTGIIPFVYARPIPRPFRVVGKSLTELIADLQTQLWVLANQRLDNTEIMSNCVAKVINGDEELLNQLGDRFPGERISLEPGQDFQWDTPPVSIIEPALAAEEALQRTMADLTGAVAYLSGAGDGTVDQSTATGISIIQSTAQKRLMSIKQEFANARNRAGQQQIELNKRLMTRPEVIMSMSGGEWSADSVEPYEIAKASCRYRVADVAESMNQQTQRMEATIKIQTLASLAPLMPGQLNFAKLVEDFSEAYGDDRHAYLVDQSAPPGVPGGLAPPGMMGLGQAPPPTTPPMDGAGSGAPPPMGGPGYVNNAPAALVGEAAQ